MLYIIACGLAFSAVSASELVAQCPWCGLGCTEKEINAGYKPCSGKCYPPGYTCYGDIACQPGYSPCGAEGNEKLCAPKGSIPCGGQCYPPGYHCYGDIACQPGYSPCEGQCAPNGSISCGGKCYPQGYHCHGRIACGPGQKFKNGKCWAP